MLEDLKRLPSEKELAEIALANYEKIVELEKIDNQFKWGDHCVTILRSPGTEIVFILYDEEYAFQYFMRKGSRAVRINNRFHAQRILM